jgi:hypothetical protein
MFRLRESIPDAARIAIARFVLLGAALIAVGVLGVANNAEAQNLAVD